jgi:hypothetical protein
MRVPNRKGVSVKSGKEQREHQPMEYAQQIQANAKRIYEMHARIHKTLRTRDTPEGRNAWLLACAELQASYNALAFPGGYDSGLRRIGEGDSDAIETALVFLELRPYFFRSGYMREKLLRRLKHAALSGAQARRFDAVMEAQRQWRAEVQSRRSK